MNKKFVLAAALVCGVAGMMLGQTVKAQENATDNSAMMNGDNSMMNGDNSAMNAADNTMTNNAAQ